MNNLTPSDARSLTDEYLHQTLIDSIFISSITVNGIFDLIELSAKSGFKSAVIKSPISEDIKNYFISMGFSIVTYKNIDGFIINW